jgi:hypothetical protein
MNREHVLGLVLIAFLAGVVLGYIARALVVERRRAKRHAADALDRIRRNPLPSIGLRDSRFRLDPTGTKRTRPSWDIGA